MKINTTQWDFDTIKNGMPQPEVWKLSKTLTNIKYELLRNRQMLIEDTFEFGQNIDEVSAIDIQLTLLDNNLKVLEEVLMYHEDKIFVGMLGNSVQIICLN